MTLLLLFFLLLIIFLPPDNMSRTFKVQKPTNDIIRVVNMMKLKYKQD